ncbi:MAG: LEA type 2 family protein [Lysobacteraceae bacterium]|jgi:Conserved secreted protein|nr:water stress/hypersensitive response domain-containing protein [Xanthomonadaceae bacterium]
MRHPARAFRQYAHIALLLLSAILLAGCASLSRRDPLQVDVAGIEPLPGEGLELRMAVKLRIRNPNDRPLVYDGAALALELNGLPVASGVSDAAGQVPRYGEAVLTIPVSVSMLDVARLVARLPQSDRSRLDYTVRGKLEGGLFGTRRFTGSGQVTLPTGPARP